MLTFDYINATLKATIKDVTVDGWTISLFDKEHLEPIANFLNMSVDELKRLPCS